MTTPTRHTAADQLAATVRDRRCCDALNPCRVCKALARAVVETRARVPEQRRRTA